MKSAHQSASRRDRRLRAPRSILANALKSTGSAGGAGVITVFNWGDYIDPDLIKQFEEETGIKVIYETFDSNEAMLTKIAPRRHRTTM